MEESLCNAAARREVLVQKISNTQHAAATLSQLKIELQELTNRFYEADSTYVTLLEAAKKEKADLDKLQGSHLRKLFNRDRFNEKLKKEEDDYIEALGWKEKAEMKRDLLRSEADEMKKKRSNLQNLAAEHVNARAELDDLYSSLFDGPTPENPQEDQLEEVVRAAQEVYDLIQTRLTHAAEVVNNLALAQMRIRSALGHSKTALGISATDIVNHPAASSTHRMTQDFNSPMADHRERYQLSWVQRSIAEAEHYMAIAQEMDPEVGGFFRPQVADGDGVVGTLDQIVDTPMTDYLFHREIKSTWQGVYECGLLLQEELDRADDRASKIEEERNVASVSLKEARDRLLDVRVEMFEKALRKKEDKPLEA